MLDIHVSKLCKKFENGPKHTAPFLNDSWRRLSICHVSARYLRACALNKSEDLTILEKAGESVSLYCPMVDAFAFDIAAMN
jgi:hypothetical protein